MKIEILSQLVLDEQGGTRHWTPAVGSPAVQLATTPAIGSQKILNPRLPGSTEPAQPSCIIGSASET